MVNKEILQGWMSENNGYILYDPLHPGVFTGYVTFTPERSKSALENNTRNRNIKMTQLEELTEQMKNGNWDENVGTITFDKNGVISNGQHRFESSVKTGITFRNLVTYGVSDRTQHYTDRGASRKLEDDFSIDKLKNSKNLSTITRTHYLINAKQFSVKAIITKVKTASCVPDSVLYDYFYENKTEIIRLERLYANTYLKVKLLKIGEVLKTLVLLFDRINSEDAYRFWEKLGKGYSEIEDDPIMLLRSRLAKHADNNQNKLTQPTIAALIIKAWNAYERGETVKQLKFMAGGANPESFPEIYNPYENE